MNLIEAFTMAIDDANKKLSLIGKLSEAHRLMVYHQQNEAKSEEIIANAEEALYQYYKDKPDAFFTYVADNCLFLIGVIYI